MTKENIVLVFLTILIAYTILLTNYRINSDSVKIKAIEVPSLSYDPFEDDDVYDIGDANEIICLAKNIYHESRGESLEGQIAVAQVTMNRVYSDRFPNNVCSVVFQRNKRGCQFTWYCQNKKVSYHNATFQETLELAKSILNYEIELEYTDTLYYHATYVKPWWAKKMQVVNKIENHIFYQERSI